MTLQHWIPIVGNISVLNSDVTLIPTPISPLPSSAESAVPWGIARSNLDFEQGTIEFDAYLPDSESSCQIILGAGTQVEIYAGLYRTGAPYGISTLKGGQWEFLAASGHGSRLKGEATYNLRLQVQGSNLDLYVDQVKVVSASYQFARGPISIFFQSLGFVAAKNIQVKRQQPACFVVMQFTDEYNALYSDVILPTCEEFKYKVTRADDFYNSGLIIEDITQSIRESALVIADITPNNPNVFYEVGFAHGIKKPTILLSDRKRERLPFDVSGFRTLFYDNTIGGKKAVEDKLRRHLEMLAS